MEFGQLIEYTTKNIFMQNSCKNEAEKLLPDLFLFYKKASCSFIQVLCNLILIYFDSIQLGIQ